MATLIDFIPFPAAFFLVYAVVPESNKSQNDGSYEITGLPVLLGFAIYFAWFSFNWVYLQGTRGQTVGKRILGIVLLGFDGQPIGPGPSLNRQLAHALDVIPCYLGLLWPLWDKEKRTFADMVMSTNVYKK